MKRGQAWREVAVVVFIVALFILIGRIGRGEESTMTLMEPLQPRVLLAANVAAAADVPTRPGEQPYMVEVVREGQAPVKVNGPDITAVQLHYPSARLPEVISWPSTQPIIPEVELVSLRVVSFSTSTKELTLGYTWPGVRTRLWKDGASTTVTDGDGTIRVTHTAGAAYQVFTDATEPEPVSIRIYVGSDGKIAVEPPEPEPAPEEPDPTPLPPVEGKQIPSGQTIPKLYGTPILLERGGTYKLSTWTVTTSGLLIDCYGDASKPEPVIVCDSSVLFDLNVQASIRNVQLKTTKSYAVGFILDGADIDLVNINFIGGNWGDLIKIADGALRARVLGFGNEQITLRHSIYDDSHGKARDCTFDLGGKTLHGSKEENVIRLKGIDGCTVRNGTILAPKGVNGQKGWMTTQSSPDIGSRNVLYENLFVAGPCGVGAVETTAGWQSGIVDGVTLRNITAKQASDISIMEGCRNVVLDGFHDYYVKDRSPLVFKGGNTKMSNRPNVTVKDCDIDGNASRFVGGDTTLGTIKYENSTWNGKELR